MRVPVYASAQSWDVVSGHNYMQKVTVAPGAVEIVDGYAMVPFEPSGAGEFQNYDLIQENSSGRLLPVQWGSTMNTKEEMQKAKVTVGVFLLFLSACCFLVFYAAAKLIAVAFFCQNGVWNL